MVLVSKPLIVEGLFCITKLGQILLKKSVRKILIFQKNCKIFEKQHFSDKGVKMLLKTIVHTETVLFFKGLKTIAMHALKLVGVEQNAD